VSGIANIHPILLRVLEVHTENSSVRSGMQVMVRGAKRYMVSDNAKKISTIANYNVVFCEMMKKLRGCKIGSKLRVGSHRRLRDETSG
jgi:hypothetical protein